MCEVSVAAASSIAINSDYGCIFLISYFKTTLFLIMLCLLQDTAGTKREIADKTKRCIESGELLNLIPAV